MTGILLVPARASTEFTLRSGAALASTSRGTSIQIQVNGESRTAPSGSTVSGLLRQLEIRPDRVAVEVNLQIVDRQSFEGRSLQDGDQVEIISFIGGG